MIINLYSLSNRTLISSALLVTALLNSGYVDSQPYCDKGKQLTRKSRDLVLYNDIEAKSIITVFKKDKIPDELVVTECIGSWRKINSDKGGGWISKLDIKKPPKIRAQGEQGVTRGFE